MNNLRFTLRTAAALLLMGTLSVPREAAAQTGADGFRFAQRYPAVGAQMMGFGGAGTAGIADYTALLSNPAGLGYFQRSMVGGTLNTLSTLDQSAFRAPGTAGLGLDSDIRTTGLNSLAYIARAPTTQGSLAFGASFNQVNTFTRDLAFMGENANNSITDFFMPLPGEFTIDVETEDGETVYTPTFFRDISRIAYEAYGIDFAPDLYESGEPVPFLPAVTAGTVEQQGRVTEEGGMKEVNFGGAVEAVRNVMLGLSANLAFGSYEFRRSFTETDFQNANDGNFGTTDFESLTLTETLESDLIGINVRGGLSTVLTTGLRFGLTLETPTYYAVNETYDTMLETFFDNGDAYQFGPGEPAGSGDFEYEIVTPWRLGVGLAFQTGPLTLGADAEFVDWSQMRFDASSDRTYFDQVNQDIRDNYDAVMNTRIGAEYQFGDLFLRGGFAYQPDPYDAGLSDAGNGAPDRSRTFFSAGIGYRFAQQLQLDFGWMQERFEDQYRPYIEVDDAPVVDEDVVRNRFAVGMRVFF